MKQPNQLARISMFIALFAIAFNVSAQLNTPRGSQMASISQTIGITKMHINYSRPSVMVEKYGENLCLMV